MVDLDLFFGSIPTSENDWQRLHLEGPRLVELQPDDVPRAEHRPLREEDEQVRAEAALVDPVVVALVLGEEVLRDSLKLLIIDLVC